jgi:protein SCO1/2
VNLPDHISNSQITDENKRPANRIYSDVKLGGSFTLVNTNGEVVTDEDFRGKWMFVYFGFSFCPDICPTEMHKMQDTLSSVNHDLLEKQQVVPIFITVDPARDSCSRIDEYFKAEKFDEFVGLTGTEDQIKSIAKKYRVFYTAPDYKIGKTDYNIDHSVFIYLMSPQGDLVEYFARNQTAEDIAYRINDILTNYKA